jgi:hypothetical protein
MSGCPAMGTAGFARTEESGRSLVPSPAERISAERSSYGSSKSMSVIGNPWR